MGLRSLGRAPLRLPFVLLLTIPEIMERCYGRLMCPDRGPLEYFDLGGSIYEMAYQPSDTRMAGSWD